VYVFRNRRQVRMTGKLEGKIALITGGSSGIGLATAQRFVTEGAYLALSNLRCSIEKGRH
jgi:NAD(P)-dependent dehydrogenase (short-subunit alcohol dehydrogenase family)